MTTIIEVLVGTFMLESLFNKVAGLHIETSSLICRANHLKHLTT